MCAVLIEATIDIHKLKRKVQENCAKTLKILINYKKLEIPSLRTTEFI